MATSLRCDPSVFPKFSPNGGGKRKGLAGLFAASPFVTRCRREDSNLHSLNGNQPLKLVSDPPRYPALTGQTRCKPRQIVKLHPINSVVAHRPQGARMAHNCTKIVPN